MLPTLALGALLAGQAVAQTQAVVPAGTNAAKPAVKSLGSAAIERRIAELHSRLAITPAQQQPFDAFAQVMRDNSQRMETLVTKGMEGGSAANAVGQLRMYTVMAQAHADNMQRLTEAFAALYDALSPDQKHRADLSLRDFVKSRRAAAG
jgi:hypothetical protein